MQHVDRLFVWLADAKEVIWAAFGERRHWVGNIVSGAVAVAAYLLGGKMTPGDKYVIGALIALLFTLWVIINHAIALARERRPQIEVSFKEAREWVVFIPRGHIGTPQGPIESPCLFFLAKIKNLSPTQPLRSVRADLTNVERHDGRVFVGLGFGQRLLLSWSKSATPQRWQPRDMPPLDEQFVDVVSVSRYFNRPVIKSEHQWQADEDLFNVPGTYRLTLCVSAIEGTPKTYRLCLKWTGRWDEMRVWPVNEQDPEKAVEPGAGYDWKTLQSAT